VSQLTGLALLRRIADAGELVRRERPLTAEEAYELRRQGYEAGEAVIEWVAPLRGAADIYQRPVVVATNKVVVGLEQLGLVVLLAGGTRAQLTPAGAAGAARALRARAAS
jgi:hypothetical protein